MEISSSLSSAMGNYDCQNDGRYGKFMDCILLALCRENEIDPRAGRLSDGARAVICKTIATRIYTRVESGGCSTRMANKDSVLHVRVYCLSQSILTSQFRSAILPLFACLVDAETILLDIGYPLRG